VIFQDSSVGYKIDLRDNIRIATADKATTTRGGSSKLAGGRPLPVVRPRTHRHHARRARGGVTCQADSGSESASDTGAAPGLRAVSVDETEGRHSIIEPSTTLYRTYARCSGPSRILVSHVPQHALASTVIYVMAGGRSWYPGYHRRVIASSRPVRRNFTNCSRGYPLS